ncbi:MAG: ligand-binding protein SH3 [Firmicutes bacterium]|nr:ligand-binding protein SH3 [Bacillota bacterium]
MNYLVIKEHKSNYPKPITLEKGERILIGEKYEGEKEWVNWRYCYKLDKSQEGWVPEQLINISNQYGILKENYTAKELTIKTGEKVKGITELNGWIWCKDENGREGWIPKLNLKNLEK